MKDWRIRAWVQSHLRVNELHLPIKERSNVLEVIYALNHNTMVKFVLLFCPYGLFISQSLAVQRAFTG